MGYSKDFNSMETTKKGIEGEKNLEKFLTTRKGFMIKSHDDKLHDVDYYLYYNDYMVAVADSKNKEYMQYRPAQGFNLSHLLCYMSEASKNGVPAIIMCQDNALGILYAIDVFHALDQHNNEIFIRIGTDIHTGDKILQVEFPLKFFGRLADLKQINPNTQILDLSGYKPGNKPNDVLPLFMQSSTSAILTAIKEGIPFPYEIDGVQSQICIPNKEVEPKQIVSCLSVVTYKDKVCGILELPDTGKLG